MRWRYWYLSIMPYCNYPDNITFNSIKKTVWGYYYFSVRKLWEFRYSSAGFRKILKPS